MNTRKDTGRHDDQLIPQRRQLPKLIACMTKNSLENMRNKALYSIDSLDMRGIRRRKLPLYECLILELKESGYTESAYYVQDLLYDNAQLVAEDDIGIVVDLRKRGDYLEHIGSKLQIAERERERENIKKECETILSLALNYKEKGKGILWLAEKFFLAAIAVASRYLLDGGRLKCVCKYHYALFLMDKFPGADTEEPFKILTEVRDAAIGKKWLLVEIEGPANEQLNKEILKEDLLFTAVTIQLNRVLLQKSKDIRKANPAKAERLARLAQRRAADAQVAPLVAEAIIEVGICQLIMNNLNNARNTFERAYNLNTQINYIEGICNVKMHQAAVMQRLGEHELAAQLLTEMGALAMEHGLRRLLGRALHLLGELHVRNERPELGTQHLIEAFCCFMGVIITENYACVSDGQPSVLALIHTKEQGMVFVEEAEQSRLMTAISSGQEKMASYFDLIRGANVCTVDRVKCMEWKLQRSNWWDHRLHHDLLPCFCPLHNRSPLDVIKIQVQQRLKRMTEMQSNDDLESKSKLFKGESIDDFRGYVNAENEEDDEKEQKETEKSEEGKTETAETAAKEKALTFEK